MRLVFSIACYTRRMTSTKNLASTDESATLGMLTIAALNIIANDRSPHVGVDKDGKSDQARNCTTTDLCAARGRASKYGRARHGLRLGFDWSAGNDRTVFMGN